ncbi:MAG: hypothetical protein FWC17_05965, partial [Treponema sp.]|nr:hypothetical protein [Treponema sp.]
SAPAARQPADKLSAAIISFARFFSLPLKPQMLADIRRQVFLQQAPLSQNAALTKTGGIAKQTALSLAAAAAESKGVQLLSASQMSSIQQQSSAEQLYPRGLESYAEAVDPDSRRQNNEERRRKRGNIENEKEPPEVKDINAENLKKISLDYLNKNPVTDIMNRLPGKNSRRWIVLPFDFSEGNRDFFVSMRVLIDEDKLKDRGAKVPVMFALDVGMNLNNETEKNGFDQRWLFAMDCAGEKPSGLTVIMHPEPAKKKQSEFVNELSGIFDIPRGKIFIKSAASAGESFPFEAQLIEPPQSVNEAV